jgi:hypothetical protein
MTYLLGRDEKHRDLIYDDDYRAYLITRNDPAGDYRFGRSYGKRDLVRVRSALRRVNGFLKNLIAAIADSKMRRMQRELRLRGIRYDRPSDNWVTRNSGPAKHSR